MVTEGHHWAPTSVRCTQFMPYYFKIIFQYYISPSKSRFSSGFPTRQLYSSFISPMRAECPAHPIIIYLLMLCR